MKQTLAEPDIVAGAGSAQRGATENLLFVSKVTKSYSFADRELRAVDSVSFAVDRGEFVSVIGPSGCGKSTLFAMVGGLIPPTSGDILIGNEPITGPHAAIGMVFQEESTFPWRTVIDNVAFPLELTGVSKSERYARAAEFIRVVGLGGFERRYPSELSGGMRQRVSIARALVAQPKLLLMDEPFAALDEQTRLLLGDTVLRIQSELDQTVLLITHNIAEAVQMSDRVVIMSYRPGTIKRVIDIDLPKPRSSEIVSSEAFGRYVASIWADLREEASRGMASAENIAKTNHLQKPKPR